MNCKEIIYNYLKERNYSGLHNEDNCGCKLDDLMPCGECLPDCTPELTL